MDKVESPKIPDFDAFYATVGKSMAVEKLALEFGSSPQGERESLLIHAGHITENAMRLLMDVEGRRFDLSHLRKACFNRACRLYREGGDDELADYIIAEVGSKVSYEP